MKEGDPFVSACVFGLWIFSSGFLTQIQFILYFTLLYFTLLHA